MASNNESQIIFILFMIIVFLIKRIFVLIQNKSENKDEKQYIKVFVDLENIVSLIKNNNLFISEIREKTLLYFNKKSLNINIIVICDVYQTNKLLINSLYDLGIDIWHCRTRDNKMNVKKEAVDKCIENMINKYIWEFPQYHYGLITHDNDFVKIMSIIKFNTNQNSKLIYYHNSNASTNIIKLKQISDHSIGIDFVKPVVVLSKPVSLPVKVMSKPVSLPVKVMSKPASLPVKVTSKPVSLPVKVTPKLSSLPVKVMSKFEKIKQGADFIERYLSDTINKTINHAQMSEILLERFPHLKHIHIMKNITKIYSNKFKLEGNFIKLIHKNYIPSSNSDIKSDDTEESDNSDIKSDNTEESDDSDIKSDNTEESDNSDIKSDNTEESDNSDIESDDSDTEESNDSDTEESNDSDTEESDDSDIESDNTEESKKNDNLLKEGISVVKAYLMCKSHSLTTLAILQKELKKNKLKISILTIVDNCDEFEFVGKDSARYIY